MHLTEDEVNRFWSKVQVGKPEQCWPWTGEVNNQGYGRFAIYRRGRVRHLAHRVAYTLGAGATVEGLGLLHDCDNPPCCNPRHLRLGTQRDNIADMHRKNRGVRPPLLRGGRNPRAKLTEENVREIFVLSASGLPATAIAPRYAVTPDAVRKVLQRKNWAHVTLVDKRAG